MRGYGPTPPDPHWPNGAKIAVQIVMNYEEGGENNILHGDKASEAFLSEIVGASAWDAQRHWNMESIYEYGARAGFWRLHRLLKDLPITVYGVATALARSPEQVAAMQEANWEIASHGLKWIEYKDFTEEEERDHMAQAIALHTAVTGARPRGWYTGRCSEHTMKLVAEEGGFAYCADSYADDLPYYERIDGRDQLVVPYTLDCNDMRFATPQGFNSGDQFETYLRDSFDALYAEGAEGVFWTMCKAMRASGSPPVNRSQIIGTRPIHPRPRHAPRRWNKLFSQILTAVSSSIPHGWPNRLGFARPLRRTGWRFLTPIPIWQASWPPPSG